MKEKTTNVVIFLIALFVTVGCAYDELGEIETNFRRTESTSGTSTKDDINPKAEGDPDPDFEQHTDDDGSESEESDSEETDADENYETDEGVDPDGDTDADSSEPENDSSSDDGVIEEWPDGDFTWGSGAETSGAQSTGSESTSDEDPEESNASDPGLNTDTGTSVLGHTPEEPSSDSKAPDSNSDEMSGHEPTPAWTSSGGS